MAEVLFFLFCCFLVGEGICFCLLFLVCSVGDGTQGLAYARQVLSPGAAAPAQRLSQVKDIHLLTVQPSQTAMKSHLLIHSLGSLMEGYCCWKETRTAYSLLLSSSVYRGR